ncbi:MAG: 5-formyltetrahydrofolate cyclo-ligase [Ferrovum sp.]|nr:5-formyltetrahydrofolate cyclo-ligase [Ferrovum sp.]NDU87506.1 5-formyltetrahydrofolate cyclo-ligase [Ferrovum sp.]
MSSTVMTLDKAAVRQEALAARARIPQEERDRRSRQLHHLFLSHPRVVQAQSVLLYGSIGTEVNTWPLLQTLLQQSRRVLLPRMERATSTLRLFEVRDLETDLAPPDRWGLREPLPGHCPPGDLLEADVILVPGVLFDDAGFRLGYGGGFYDRLLGSVPQPPFTLALAFREQCVASVPRDPHDRPVDQVMNDDGAFPLQQARSL